jgi:hypothetical protein
MKTLLFAVALCALACTKRQPTPSTRVVSSGPDVAPIERVDARSQIDATAPAQREHTIASQACTDMRELSAGLENARDAGADWFACRTGAGVQLRLALGVAEGTKPLWIATIMQRSMLAMSPARRRQEATFMENDARAVPDRFASAELALRNPQRTVGRLAIVRGTVISAEESGVTALIVGVGPLEITPIDVVYPATAEEWVVAGARVRVGGAWGERDGKPVLFAGLIERR